MDVRAAASGGYSAGHPKEPRSAVAVDEQTYRRLWSSMIGDVPMKEIDFETESAVFLLAGSRPTGGWSIDVRGGTVEGETLVLDAPIKGPPPNSIVTQAFTSPWAVVAVKSKAFKDVRWQR